MSFEAYWVKYLAAHRGATVRRAHVAATGAALFCGAVGIVTRQRWLLLASPGIGLLPAWLSHRLDPGADEVPEGRPLYGLFANLLLFFKTLDGTIAAEFEKLHDVSSEPNPASGGGPVLNMVTDGTLH